MTKGWVVKTDCQPSTQSGPSTELGASLFLLEVVHFLSFLNRENFWCHQIIDDNTDVRYYCWLSILEVDLTSFSISNWCSSGASVPIHLPTLTIDDTHALLDPRFLIASFAIRFRCSMCRSRGIFCPGRPLTLINRPQMSWFDSLGDRAYWCW